MCDVATAMTVTRPPSFHNIDRAYAYIMPEAFAMIAGDMLQIDGLRWGRPEMIHKFGVGFFDKIFTAYYKAWSYPVTMADRPGSEDRNSLPLTQRNIVHSWLKIIIREDPDEMWSRLNCVLRDVPALVHPIYFGPFFEKIIPRSCFPREPSARAALIGEESNKEWGASCTAIIDEANARLDSSRKTGNIPSNLDQIEYQNAVAEAKQYEDIYKRSMGHWDIDINGNRTWVSFLKGDGTIVVILTVFQQGGSQW
ncbi:hypothetical protein BT63DRAFT_187229 [Microthyrium microscopicum]|uniref:DUF7514 domain-containing protein n=1 Tax=Microthyrium microscopicum TaxID=703497 RepID=A0A6A6UIP5_9PEZI|nr:hypothetical protein BT63DRAFT_187229 [Microthyrium microscopicum]